MSTQGSKSTSRSAARPTTGQPDGRSAPASKRRAARPAAAPAIVLEPAEVAPGLNLRQLLRGFGACAISMVLHIIILVLLGLLVMPQAVHEQLTNVLVELYKEELEEETLVEELQEQIEVANQMTFDVVSPRVQIGMEGSGVGSAAPPQLDKKVVDQLDSTNIKVGPPNIVLPSESYMIQEVPEGTRGDERYVVDSTQQALSQITQELLVLLEKGPVLVVWLFDMSDSMEDDRKEIRDRFERIYQELGISGKAANDRLLTAICSYGEGFFVNTRRGPTSKLSEIRAAINSIKNDHSGKELMCRAIGTAINRHRGFATRGDRQLVLILVSDESGEPEDNDQFLEKAISEAKSARCRIYVLGREAAFGYPYVRFAWRHPQTRRLHWLPVDRGPETAFPEQLQIDGFHRRWTVFSSGFGPYAQTRMARETGGIFFMLPTEEGAQRGFQKNRYKLEDMRSYKPDLRAKREVVADRDTYPLRALIWKVVSDLNPHRSKEYAKKVELRVHFSRKPDQFLRQKAENQAKAKQLLKYLAAAQKELEDNAKLLEQEPSPRWRANYELMLAQLVAFQVRVHEYGVYLDWFVKHPRNDPPAKEGGAKVLIDYRIRRRRLTLAENEKLWKDYPARELVLQYLDRAKKLLRQVSAHHPGTPWDAVARWELGAFGVELYPYYDEPIRDVKNPIPIPVDPSPQ